MIDGGEQAAEDAHRDDDRQPEAAVVADRGERVGDGESSRGMGDAWARSRRVWVMCGQALRSTPADTTDGPVR